MPKTKPNDPCHCGSGNKYKKCCHVKDQTENSMVSRMTPSANIGGNMYQMDVDHERDFAFRLGYLRTYLAAMDQYLPRFFDEWRSEGTAQSYPALDIGSGAGLFPVEYAKHFRSSKQLSLTWYCSEYKGLSSEHRNPLMALAACQATMLLELNPRRRKDGGLPKGDVVFPTLLCADTDGNALFRCDPVKLVDLKNQTFNGLKGAVSGWDPQSKDRLAVMLEGRKDPISFKPTNLLLIHRDVFRKVTIDEALQLRDDFELVHDMSNHKTLNINVQQKELCWHVGRQLGIGERCAVVTCTSLLTEVGRRVPLIWQDVLDRASYFLEFGGYFFHHDTVDFGGFGDEEIMRAYGDKCLSAMELVEISEPIQHPKDIKFLAMSGVMKLAVWRKKGDVPSIRRQRYEDESLLQQFNLY